MTKHKILVVEPDENIRNMLDIYFTRQGYDVIGVETGQEAKNLPDNQVPDVIILDDVLSDIDFIDLFVELRTNSLTKNIPVIFLIQTDERIDDIAASQIGLDSILTKPFDIEELKLRIGQVTMTTYDPHRVNHISNFPTGEQIEEHLRDLMRKGADWSYIDIKITNFDPFKEVYGWQAGDEVIRATALMITDTLKEHGTDNDFAGHPGNENFVIISHATEIETLIEALEKRFNTEVQQYHSSTDHERGYMFVGDKQKGLLTLATGSVSTRTHQFADIREIVELAVADRRRKSGDGGDSNDEPPILTAW